MIDDELANPVGIETSFSLGNSSYGLLNITMQGDEESMAPI